MNVEVFVDFIVIRHVKIIPIRSASAGFVSTETCNYVFTLMSCALFGSLYASVQHSWLSLKVCLEVSFQKQVSLTLYDYYSNTHTYKQGKNGNWNWINTDFPEIRVEHIYTIVHQLTIDLAFWAVQYSSVDAHFAKSHHYGCTY